MNYKLLAMLFFTFFSVFCLSTAKTIYNPHVEKANTEHIMINRLELSDSLTVLHCDAYHQPNYWVKISSETFLRGESGKKYKLIHCTGMETDKEIFMPESGTMPFILSFEPLSKDEKCFDLIEDTENEEDNLLGVKTIVVRSEAPVQCLIKGEVIGRPYSSRMKLIKYNEDLRTSGTYIPIRNGKFEYPLNCEVEEAYTLNFTDEFSQGSWFPIMFFAENGTVSMKLHPKDEVAKNIVEGGELNKAFQTFVQAGNSFFGDERESLSNERDELDISGAMYSEATKNIYELLKMENQSTRDSLYRELDALRTDGKFYSPQGNAIEERFEKQQQKEYEWELRYMKENISLASYLVLLERIINIQYNPLGEKPYAMLFNEIYQSKYPEHPFTQEIQRKLDAMLNVRKGGKYIDFTAPDFDGNPVTLSEHIKGKVALIDLWASWCGPCRRLSVSMIPVYEEYKDKGFTVLGVAREENAKHAITAARKDGYPWLNLVEVKDENKIWEKYGIGNSGGNTFLIDRDGTILAVHPTAEEVRNILKEILP